MLIYALVIHDSPWNKSSADTVYNFLKVLILYEAQHIISKIHKIRNCLAREKMIAMVHLPGICFMFWGRICSFFQTRILSLSRALSGVEQGTLPPITTPAPIPALSLHVSARWAARSDVCIPFSGGVNFLVHICQKHIQFVSLSRLSFAPRRVRPLIQPLAVPWSRLSLYTCVLNKYIPALLLPLFPSSSTLRVW